MKMLDSKVNIIPIIAKADTVAKDELQKFKVSFRNQFSINEIKMIFAFRKGSIKI